MANADRPSGFTPLRHAFGGVIRANPYHILHGYTTGLFTGDMVILSGGLVNIGAQDSSVPLGVFGGCRYTAPDGSVVFSKHWPASQAVLGDTDLSVPFVYDDPGIVFSVQ